MSQYRTTLSTTLASHLASGAAKTASADGVVGYSIVQVLTTTGAETDLLRQIGSCSAAFRAFATALGVLLRGCALAEAGGGVNVGGSRAERVRCSF